jgi:zinc transport system substrate-binding protein
MAQLKSIVAVLLSGAAALMAPSTASANLDVVVTIKPIHSLVTRLMEGTGTPKLLVDGPASPHAFSLKPSHARAINNADVFIRVSETVEPFTGKIVKAVPETVRVVTLEEAPGVELLDVRDSGSFEQHAAAEEHGHESEADGHHGAIDGHIWLDPDNAKAIVAYLTELLAERSPADAAKLRRNATQLKADIDVLSVELQESTRSIKDKPFIVFHDAYQYFGNRFGVDAVGSVTVSPEVPPSAKRLNELRAKIRALNVVCVFAEPLFQPRLIAAVIEDTNARSGTLDPTGMMLAAGKDLYFELMRDLAAGLKSCLEART